MSSQNTSLTVVNEHDSRVIEMWLHGRPMNTKEAYARDTARLQAFTSKPLQQVTLADLQAFSDSLTDVSESSKARILKAIKSLYTFAFKLGYVPLNVAAALRVPTLREDRAQRILTEEQTIRLIDATRDNARNHALLRLVYHCGIRVSEVVSIKWSDLVERQEGGQVTIFGKGNKTRNILIGQAMWDELMSLDGRFTGDDRYVFQSRKGKAGIQPLDESQVLRIVKDAAKKVGIKGNVSPHWLRHAHASHSLDRGANINLVRDTLGHANIATTGKYTHARPNASSSQYLPL